MSFLDKVAAIRSELGLEPKEELATPAAMMAAMTLMGIVPEPSWALPQKVEALVDALGLTFGETSAAAALGVAAATTSPPSRSWRKASKKPPEASSSSFSTPGNISGKRSASVLFVEAPSASKQPKLTKMEGITRLFMTKEQRGRFSARQDVGEAVSVEEMQQSVALEVKELPSEKAPPPLQPKAVYNCSHCYKAFGRPCELAGHMLWRHPSQPRSVTMPARRFHGSLSASLVAADGDGVRLTLCINGKDREQIRREAEVMERAVEAAIAERETESTRRRHRALRLREAEGALGEQRRGSAHRHQYIPFSR